MRRTASLRLAATVCGLLLAVGLGACAKKNHRTPESLRDAYVAALRADDPAAAYALLDPATRTALPFAEFERRWKAQTAERKAALAAAEALPASARAPVQTGTTVHPGGRVLSWTKLGDRYYVTDGLPGVPPTTTPAETIRALIAAVRSTDMSKIRGVLGRDLTTSLREDWTARTDAMESALERPGAIELSGDLERAELRYEPDRVLTLEQTPHGWRVIGLE